MLIALRIRDFRLLLTSQVLSNIGDWFLLLAVPYYILELTGSTFASGVSLAAETLPGILLSPIAGVFADRWDRRRTMIGTSVIRAFVVAALLLARDPGDIWIIYVALTVESAAGQFFNPARAALVPGLVGRGTALVAANSLSAMANGTVRLVGSVAGGALYAITGFHVVVVVDVASYVVAAVLIAMIRPLGANGSGVAPPTDPTGAFHRFATDVVEGWRHVWHRPALRVIFTVSLLLSLGTGAMNTMLVPYVITVLHGTSSTVGWLMSAFGGGLLLGASVYRFIGPRISLRTLLAVVFPALSVLFFAAFNIHHAVTVGVLFALVGVPLVCANVATETFVQQQAHDEILGRVASTSFVLQAGGSLLGTVTGAALGQAVSPVATTNMASVIIAVAGATTLLLPRPPGHSSPPRTPTVTVRPEKSVERHGRDS